jgi:acyl-CoA synthetase (AMP-forming)/AMP-acid ligase II
MSQGDGTPDVQWADAYGNPHRPLVITSTGGTTGVAKAVLVNNLSWATMIETGLRHVVRDGEIPVCLAPMPLTHGARGFALTTFAAGGTNVILPKFDAPEVLRQIAQHRVTHMFLPPTAFYALLTDPQVANVDHSSLRVLIISGAPVSPDKLRKGVELFGPCLAQAYGQVESPSIVTWMDPEAIGRAVAGEHPERLLSCGTPTSYTRVAILDDAGKELPNGERGEVCVRGHLVTPGYYKNAEATAETKAGGWHHTGDVGYLDEDGFLYIVDRKKQMIITGGFNVYPAEVEAVLMELAQIRDCAVIGVPDPKWGEAIKAIVLADGGDALSEADVIAHCKARLGGVKAPKTVEFRTELPRTAVGKVDKKVLRAPYWEGHERSI